MDAQTWTLLITILLKVSDFLFNSEFLVNNRQDPAASHLIKLITETVLLAIIKSSFSFNLNIGLWNQLMNLLSSVSSNPDVVDKWIEVIDDLIRQVLKSCYNIDINNLPLNAYDQKRKLKKKILYNTTTTPLSTSSIAQSNSSTNLTQQQQQPSGNTSGSNLTSMFQQQQQKMNLFSKTRSQTHSSAETAYSPIAAPTNANSSNTPAISNFISSLMNQSNVTQSSSSNNKNANNANSTSNNNNNNSSSSSSNTTLSTSLPLNVQTNGKPEGLSNSATINGSSKSSLVASNHQNQPVLNRQPSTKIQNTFRDDTYLHTLGILNTNDLDSVKSPSLSGDHFLAINSNPETPSKQQQQQQQKSPVASIKDSKTKLNYYLEQNSPTTTTTTTTTDNLSNFDEDDETFDKSATLKATNNNFNNTENHHNNNNNNNNTSPLDTYNQNQNHTNDNTDTNNGSRRMDRFNSEKSIYYSSEYVNENGTSLNNDNDSNSSSNCYNINNSFTTPPAPSTTTQQVLNNSKLSPLQQQQIPPPLPPLNNNNNNNIPQQPPPLPPLPASLASKYSLSVKTYQLESNFHSTTTHTTTTTTDPATTPVLTFNDPSYDEQRKLKGMSVCSDTENYLKDFMHAPHIDTNSESMSGGELSGDTFASPVTAATTNEFTDTLLIQSATTSSAKSSSAINDSLNSSLFSGNTTSETSGLLLIDSSRNNLGDERSASFIDTKFLLNEQASKVSSPSTNTLVPDVTNVPSVAPVQSIELTF
jgi:hypothetical protein